MAKYRKKPVVIDAELYQLGMEDGFEELVIVVGMGEETISNLTKIISNWYGDIVKDNTFYPVPYINTLEGKHYISPGDYIITGVKGERYPCKPDIFAMTYEAVEEGDNNEN